MFTKYLIIFFENQLRIVLNRAGYPKCWSYAVLYLHYTVTTGWLQDLLCRYGRVFQIAVRDGGWGKFPPVGGIRNFAGVILLQGGANLTRSDFDSLNLFQS